MGSGKHKYPVIGHLTVPRSAKGKGKNKVLYGQKTDWDRGKEFEEEIQFLSHQVILLFVLFRLSI